MSKGIPGAFYRDVQEPEEPTVAEWELEDSSTIPSFKLYPLIELRII